MGKNVAVFVDVANIFYAAKAAGTDIDYVTLLKAATAGRDFVRAYAYTGLDPDNENQRNFHAFLARNHYKVVSKDIRKYGDGKVKANLDIELVVDLMKTARNLDIAIVISGDGDFAPAIRAVQEMGVRVEVISFRGNTSSDLIEVADLFTDITQLARVDKGSSRSGRRVAGDEEDLSMTEVPDKQTEGTGTRGRGRGRGRLRPGEAEPIAARGRSTSRSSAAGSREPAAVGGNGSLTVLPGEKLSRVAPSGGSLEVDLEGEDEEPTIAAATQDDLLDGAGEADEAGRRRRRRRGGRGRGRGRGRDGEALPADEAGGPAQAGIGADLDDDESDEEDEILQATPAPRGPRPTPFGSVWDSQLGVPSRQAPAAVGPVSDDEDFDEPEIPEYLIAEQRRGRQQAGGRGGQGGRGGPRGGRSAYTSAIERERYGRGGGGGINRYPDVSGRDRDRQPDRPQPSRSGGRPDAGFGRQERFDRPAPRSGDPWSEVPPELEEMLRAQLAQSPKGRRPVTEAAPTRVEAETAPVVDAAAPKRRAPSRRKAEPAGGGAPETSATASMP
ncbi:MAG TPA: NYN domain-containing protein, partial [Candidatus Limnocylindrales bacterium]|nr:NYN domain-containing protein [Candidatus Limnocylindrales bacterium]